MAKFTWRTVNVYADGSIDYVTKMDAVTGDGIAWFIQNMTSLTIKVRVKDFHKKSGGSNFTVVDFFCDDSCTVNPGKTPGIIVGQIAYKPSSVVTTKYSIAVKVDSGGWIVTDPDLDVDRP